MSVGKSSHPADILVIDDDFFIRQFLDLHLKQAGYAVRVAEDAAEGGMMMRQKRPDLVILDIRLPYMDGDEFLKLLRGDGGLGDIKVIVLTSLQNDVLQLKMTRMGVSAYLRKPIVVETLLEAIAGALTA